MNDPTRAAKAAGMTTAEAMRAVRAVYADFAARPVRRDCTGVADCCRFRLTGRTPYLTLGESLVAAAAWRAAGRTGIKPTTDGSCPLLGTDGRCLIYDGRPFGCRTHYCAAAGGPLARAEVREFIQRLEAIDHQLGGQGAVNLPTALQYALDGHPRSGRRTRA